MKTLRGKLPKGAFPMGYVKIGRLQTGDQPKPVSKSSTDYPVRIWIDIRISNGLHLSQKNLSYQDLVRMVEKLEVLC